MTIACDREEERFRWVAPVDRTFEACLNVEVGGWCARRDEREGKLILKDRIKIRIGGNRLAREAWNGDLAIAIFANGEFGCLRTAFSE